MSLAFLVTVACYGRPLRNNHELTMERLGEGDLVSLHPAGAAFPCTERDDGFDTDGTHYTFKEHYDDSTVDVFFPKAWSEHQAINLVFFFHGWYSSVSDTLHRFNLIRQFQHSGINALLVVPETARDAPDSYGGKLEYTDGFRTLVDEILGTLQKNGLIRQAKVGSIVLSGHSGAYHVISQILRRGGLTSHVRDVILFDGLYGNLQDFENWVDRRRGRLISVFTEDGDAVSYTYAMIDDLVKRGVPLLLEKESSEKSTLPPSVRAVFFKSDRDHYDVVGKADQFETLLRHDLLSFNP